MSRSTVLVNVFLAAALTVTAQTLMREEFESLEAWEEIRFEKVDTLSRYRTTQDDGLSVLAIESDGGASGLVATKRYNIYEYPVLEWRWQAKELLENGNVARKSGDDYAVRVYVLFEYDPSRVSAFNRIKYNLAKLFHGEYPPLHAINYIWANGEDEQGVVPNPFSDRSMMVIKDAGTRHLNSWRSHTVNVVEDYREIFGEEPPETVSLAVMGDADNTGGFSRGCIDYVEVRR